MSKDTFDNDLYDYLEENNNECAHCGNFSNKTYCSKGCKIADNE